MIEGAKGTKHNRFGLLRLLIEQKRLNSTDLAFGENPIESTVTNKVSYGSLAETFEQS